jgi:hypothetical protein
LYSDGIETRWFGSTLALEGEVAAATTFDDLPPAVQSNAEARRQFAVFNWFTDGLISPIEGSANAYGDMRITAAVESLTPLWGLQFDPSTGAPRRWNPPPGQRRELGRTLRSLIFGDPRYKLLPELGASNAR